MIDYHTNAIAALIDYHGPGAICPDWCCRRQLADHADPTQGCWSHDQITVTSITMSIPPRILSPNARPHWGRLASVKKRRREMVAMLARASMGQVDPPRWKQAELTPVFYWPSSRRRDRDNAQAMLKADIDGLVDAGLLDDDEGLLTMPAGMLVDKAAPRVVLVVRDLGPTRRRLGPA